MVLKILPRDSNRASYELKVALMSSEGLSNTANVLSVEYCRYFDVNLSLSYSVIMNYIPSNPIKQTF